MLVISLVLCIFLTNQQKLDINMSNIMLTVDDESILSNFEKAEADNPSPTKVVDHKRIIYGSRKLGLPKNALWGQPVLCDFGEARIGESHRGLIQPELYRAPEVLFGMEWTTSADVWNVAVLVSTSTATKLRSILKFNDISGTYWRIGIYSMRWMKICSRQQLTTLLKWLHILNYHPSNI
jgi:serine/threonine protein kinase